ncbi:MAG TPA: RdgB/HAM1 family non-canonical purine NTP pyrophosphatase [Blastocatellia bacterium]|nr:RdgB/HAM1 family non-canonical purine NTP pyrophosphatase [Blastocatellia bacterium]
MHILLATTNQGKLAELRQIIGGLALKVVGLRDCESTEEIEIAPTFAENALLKARYYHRLRGLPVIADDSGLEVDALAGAPGVRSARYAGPDSSDADRVSRLLAEMKDVPPECRRARFVCAAAIAWGGGEKVFLGEVAGVITSSPRGQNGFGFDPVFFYEGLGKTFAQLTQSEKAEVSHRGRAFRRLGAWLNESRVLDTLRSGDRIVTTAD